MTQEQKILKRMANLRGIQEWFIPTDFMKDNLEDLYVGYEASARLSELASDYPYLIESKRSGKYMARRVRWETISDSFHKLPQDLRRIINPHLTQMHIFT